MAVFETSIYYPESDGKPMGETDLHRDAMFRHIELLKRYYQGQQAYVTGDLLLYYEKGNAKKFIVPDLLVTKGLEQFRRRIYKLWNEGVPHFVLETTSNKTKKKDLEIKPQIYAGLGIAEYFLFDPTCDYLDPQLQGNRLVNGEYQRVATDARGRLFSQQWELELCVEHEELQFYRIDNGQRLLTAAESCELEAEARLEAEAEVAKLRERLRELGG
ncbi:MAG: Uma2 family endonuclease [Pirellulaceae bacterium]